MSELPKRLGVDPIGLLMDEGGNNVRASAIVSEIVRRWNLVAEWEEKQGEPLPTQPAPPPCRCAEVARLIVEKWTYAEEMTVESIISRLREIGEGKP